MANVYIELPVSGGGASLTDIRTSVSSSTTITLAFATANVYVGNPSSSATYTMPAISGNTDQWFEIKNRGTANITLSAGASEIYYNAAVASFVIYPGEAYKLINDGTYWLVF